MLERPATRSMRESISDGIAAIVANTIATLMEVARASVHPAQLPTDYDVGCKTRWLQHPANGDLVRGMNVSIRVFKDGVEASGVAVLTLAELEGRRPLDEPIDNICGTVVVDFAKAWVDRFGGNPCPS